MTESGAWSITWGDKTWTEDDLTGSHAALITLLSGKDAWELLDPFAGPVTLMQIIAVLVSVEEQRDPLEVVAEIGSAPLKDLLAAVSVE